MQSIGTRRYVCTILGCALSLTRVAYAQNGTTQPISVLLTMDELPQQPINGLAVKGVTFNDTTGAIYNSANGGQLMYVQDPAILGNTTGETITITFPSTVTNVSFGLSLSAGPFTPGALVQLFGPAGNSLGTFPVNVLNIPGNAFPNGLFSSNLVISQAVITFPAELPQNTFFGLDNLAFTPAPAAEVESVYQLRYLANLNQQGDSYINLTNAGTLNGADPAGRICVNVYTFTPAEQMISCCACMVTPNGLNFLSASRDLFSYPLSLEGPPTSLTVKLVASLPLPGNTCNPGSVTASKLARGLRAWATTPHLNTWLTPAAYQLTETPFSSAELSAGELSKLTGLCGFIEANGSGFGICRSCRSGALGAAQQ